MHFLLICIIMHNNTLLTAQAALDYPFVISAFGDASSHITPLTSQAFSMCPSLMGNWGELPVYANTDRMETFVSI